MRMQVLIIGLGQFGMSLAKTLSDKGAEVIGADIDKELVDEASAFLEDVICLDATDEISLAKLCPKDRDIVICAIGSREASILTTALLKQMGCENVIARAAEKIHERILKAVGAKSVINPDEEYGKKYAYKILFHNVITDVSSDDIQLLEIDILLIEILERLHEGETGVLQTLHHVDHISLVDIAGAGSAGHEINGGYSEQSHFLRAFQREQAVLVLQQDHGLGRGRAGHLGMGLEVGGVAVLVALEMRSLHDVLQHPLHVPVEVGLGKFAALHCVDQPPDLGLVAGHHQVVAGGRGLHGALLAAPVGHHDTVEAPLVAQDPGQQVIALLGIFSVELVVRRHHRPGFGLLDCYFEALEVDLAQGAGVHAGVVLMTVGLLVVHCEVLD